MGQSPQPCPVNTDQHHDPLVVELRLEGDGSSALPKMSAARPNEISARQATRLHSASGRITAALPSS